MLFDSAKQVGALVSPERVVPLMTSRSCPQWVLGACSPLAIISWLCKALSKLLNVILKQAQVLTTLREDPGWEGITFSKIMQLSSWGLGRLEVAGRER